MKKLIACLLSLLMVMGMSPVYAKNKQREGLKYRLRPMKLSFDHTPYVSHGKSKRKKSAPSGYHYFYDQLDQNGKNVYMALYNMAKTGTRGYKVPFTLDVSDEDFSSEEEIENYAQNSVYDAEYAVGLDNPDFLTLYTNLYDPTNSNTDTSDDPVLLSEMTYDGDTISSAVYYTDDCKMYTDEEEELRSTAANYFEENDIDTNQPDAVVAKEIHDTLIKNVDYDEAVEHMDDDEPLDIAHTAYGSLVNGDAVCDGYSLGYEYLCDLAHIKSTVVDGYINNENKGHAWNMVYLSGEWYEIDTTWDDDTSSTGYYNLTTDQMSDDGEGNLHIRDDYGAAPYLPTATGTHFTADYMYWNNEEITNSRDTLGNQVDHYNKADGDYKTLSDSKTYDHYSIHVLKSDKTADDYIWKESSTVSNDLNIDDDWNDHELKLSRTDDHTASTGSIDTKVIFDNGQYTTISSSIDLLKWNNETSKAATCTQNGEKAIYDESGAYVLSGSYATIPALGHDYGNWEQYNAIQHKRVCKRDASHVDYANHNFTATITAQPTCTQDGVRTYTCGDCGYAYTETIKATGHSYDNVKVTRKATTSKTGQEVYTCTKCGNQKVVSLPKRKGIVVVTNKKVKVKGSKVTTKTKTVRLKTNGLKGKKKWKISNKRIARIKNGKVTFRRKGKVTVTLKCGKKTYKVTITYKK